MHTGLMYKFLFENSDIPITDAQYEKLRVYSDFLLEYNKNVNLTAIKKTEDVFIKHFIDSIIVLKYINIPHGAKLIDVGTGAGFPAVPLKIMRPDLEITLLDCLNKRIVFLDMLSKKLGINAEIVHSRAEDFAKSHAKKYNIVTSRAVAPMPKLCSWCLPFLKDNSSRFIAYKSINEDILSAEIDIKKLGGNIVNIFDFSLINQYKRRLVEINLIC